MRHDYGIDLLVRHRRLIPAGMEAAGIDFPGTSSGRTTPMVIMAEMDYPNPTPDQMYMVYDVSVDAVEPELYDRPWFIDSLVKDANGAPVIVTYTNLFPIGLR